MCSRRFKPRAVFSFYLGLFLLGAAAASCGGGGGGGGSSDNEPPPPDHTVTAVAYANIYTGSRRTLFVLDGSQSSDSSGQALNYQWSQGLGPSVVLSPSAASAVASFYPALDYAGDYVFVLTVANGSVSGSDSVRLTVTNQAPTALAGATPSAGTRQTVFTLSASQSQDPDNDPLLYQWDQVAGPSVLLQPSSTAASVSFLPEPGYTGDYLFHLTVDDGLAVSGDSVRVRVDNSGPVAQVVQ